MLDGFKDTVKDHLAVKCEWPTPTHVCDLHAPAAAAVVAQQEDCAHADLNLALEAVLMEPCWCCWFPAAVAGTWTQVNTGTYLGTIAFAYLSFVMFILFFLGLVLFQSAVSEELGLCEQQAAASFCQHCHTHLGQQQAAAAAVASVACVCILSSVSSFQCSVSFQLRCMAGSS